MFPFIGNEFSLLAFDLDEPDEFNLIDLNITQTMLGAALSPPDVNPDPYAAVPTLSQWGIIILGLLMLILGTVVLQQRFLVRTENLNLK